VSFAELGELPWPIQKGHASEAWQQYVIQAERQYLKLIKEDGMRLVKESVVVEGC
jgi:hypothetical protein